MKKVNYLLLSILILSFASFSFFNPPNEFNELLIRSNLKYTKPENLIETKRIENEQMNYEYALKNTAQNFEVRYSIRPMDTQLENFKKEGGIHPNNWWNTVFQATLMNIAIDGPDSGEMPNIVYFDSIAVKKEFNADYGATAFTNLGKQFGQDYKCCVTLTIHKDFIGDAYIFYLANDRETINKNMKAAFHSLKFK